MTGTLRIGKYEWKAKDATFAACVLPLDEADRSWGTGTNGLAWSFDISTEPIRIDQELVTPHLYHQVFLAPVRSWRDLEGMEFPSVAPTTGANREVPSICIHEHGDIQNAAFSFGNRTGSLFEFRLSGEYAWFETTPDLLKLDTWMRFNGAVTFASSEQEALQLVCQHLDGSHLCVESTPPIDMTRGRYQYRFLPREVD